MLNKLKVYSVLIWYIYYNTITILMLANLYYVT